MTDREKTIKEMTLLRNWLLHMEEFNAHGNSDMYHEFGCTVYSALEILKEQEAELLQQEAELDILRNIYKQDSPSKQKVKWK